MSLVGLAKNLAVPEGIRLEEGDELAALYVTA